MESNPMSKLSQLEAQVIELRGVSKYQTAEIRSLREQIFELQRSMGRLEVLVMEQQEETAIR